MVRTTVTEWVPHPNLSVFGCRDCMPHPFPHRPPWHSLGIPLGRAEKLGLKPRGVSGPAPTISSPQSTTQLTLPEDAGLGCPPKAVLGRCHTSLAASVSVPPRLAPTRL